MNVIPIFSSFIIIDHLNCDIKHKSQEMLKNKEQVFLDAYEFTDLSKDVEDRFNKVIDETLNIKNHKCVLQECWLNKGNTKHIAEPHYHPGYFLSAVYYVKSDPFTSKLRFITTTPFVAEKIPQTKKTSIVENFNQFNSTVWDINSIEGMLLIFPSWLYHYVIGDDKERISLAFNAVLEEK